MYIYNTIYNKKYLFSTISMEFTFQKLLNDGSDNCQMIYCNQTLHH